MRASIKCFDGVRRAAALGVVCVALSSAMLARGGSIFDDDWMPPKPISGSQFAPVTPTNASTVPSGATQPAPQIARAKPDNGDAEVAQASRRPIPAGNEQAQSRRLLKSTFADRLNDRSIEGRRKLAVALLDEVPHTADNSSDEYVLLGGAIDASKEAADLDLCFKAADAMASQYQVDGLSIKADAVLKMDFRGGSPERAAENVRGTLGLVDLLVSRDDFRTAERLIVQGRLAAARNAAVMAQVQQRGKEIDALRLAHERARAAAEKLKSSPDDPAANLAVGGYLCFGKGDWEDGVMSLAKSSDANLRRLAALEIARPSKPGDIIQLGDGWWDAAVHQSDAYRMVIQQHAACFYETALKSATGLQRSLLARRIAEASAFRRQPLALGSEDIAVKKFVGEFTDEAHGPLFKIDSPDVPDVLNVDAGPGRLHIFGTKRVNGDAPAVLGKASGWLGKAVLLRLPEARGTITVSAIDAAQSDYKYYIMFVGTKGSPRLSTIDLKTGTTYAWSVSRAESNVIFTITDGNETLGSVTTPISDFYSFGFATTLRHGGSRLDMEIAIEG